MKGDRIDVEQQAVPWFSSSVPQQISAKMAYMADRYITSDVVKMVPEILQCVWEARVELF